jgi:hypothetical protein
MKHISKIIRQPVIRAALATEDKSEAKQRLMHLYEIGLVDGYTLETIIDTKGLRHE